jgi:2,3-bisphosphoglycerate-dependent phosphoglycerate mutase
MNNSILLIRHAQSANNALPETQRVPDPGLTELGKQQALRLGESIVRYPIGNLYCSPFKRSLDTTVPICRAIGLVPFVHADIYEQGGCYAGHLPGQLKGCPGMNRSEIESQYPGWSVDSSIGLLGWNHGRNYETEREVLDRARRVERWLANEIISPSDSMAAMVIHADFKRVLMEVMLQSGRWPNHEQPIWNTSISLLRYNGQIWELVEWNRVEHLEERLLSE